MVWMHFVIEFDLWEPYMLSVLFLITSIEEWIGYILEENIEEKYSFLKDAFYFTSMGSIMFVIAI